MTSELSRSKIFPRLEKLVPYLLCLPGDTRLVSPDSSNLDKHFCSLALEGALPFLDDNPPMKCFQTCGSPTKDPASSPNLSALVSLLAITYSDLQNESHKCRTGLNLLISQVPCCCFTLIMLFWWVLPWPLLCFHCGQLSLLSFPLILSYIQCFDFTWPWHCVGGGGWKNCIADG